MPIGVPRLDPERFGWHDLGTDADATHDLDDGAVTFLALPTGAAAVGDLAVRAEQVAYELLSTVPADSLAGLAWRMMSRRAGLTPDDLERVTLWRGIVRRRIPT